MSDMHDETTDDREISFGEDEVTEEELYGEPIGSFKGGRVTLPNGFRFDGSEIRTVDLVKLGGEAEDILTSGNDDAMEELIAAHITCLGDDIKDKKEIRRAVGILPSGDATLLVVRLRQATLGDVFDFSVACPRKPCSFLDSAVSLNLAERGCMYSPELLDFPMERELRDGRKFTFKLLTLRDQQKVKRAKEEAAVKDKGKKNIVHSAVLFLQLKTLDGEKLNSINDVVQRCDMGVRAEMRAIMDEHQFGMDLDIEHTCRKCGHTWEMTAPIGTDPRFFFPSATKRRSKPRSSSR